MQELMVFPLRSKHRKNEKIKRRAKTFRIRKKKFIIIFNSSRTREKIDIIKLFDKRQAAEVQHVL